MTPRAATRYLERITGSHSLVLALTCCALLFFNFLPLHKVALPDWSDDDDLSNENDLDAALQQAAITALGQRDGAIIVMDPQTGRVRALVNPQLAFERAVMTGSTIKPFTALTALRAGLLDANSRTVCPGRFKGLGFSVVCVHEDHLPPFTPAQAIAYSCNYYFGTLGERLGQDKLVETLTAFGFGQPTGLNADEAKGTLRPCEAGNSAKIRSEDRRNSSGADCGAREAIGESDRIQATPIQLLTAYAALVNGGHLFQPRVGNAGEGRPIERSTINITDQQRQIITEGMTGAVRYGTAKNAGLDSLPFYLLGKTGTSLPAKGFRTNGWFVGFAGKDRNARSNSLEANGELGPNEIHLAVLVFLNRSHGSEAALLARPVFETFANEANKFHRRNAEERKDNEEKKPFSSPLRDPQSAIKVHLVHENITQELSLEDYVFGVMRAEGSMETEPEALRALAIAIRTYALKNLGRHARDGYDFCSTTHCQRFALSADRGTRPTVGEGPLLDAVRATEGRVLLDQRGQLVDAYFGASCGGQTANLGTLWGVTPPEYLRGVRDEYCLSGPHATWTDVITRADLLRALQSDARTNVGARLDQVIVSKRDETGRAEFITLEGEHRKTIRGWDFKIIVGRVLGWNLIKSSRFEVARSGSNFVFSGSGFGHGLGLCQEGAHVMAARGSSCQRILEKYFPGTSVMSRPRNTAKFNAGDVLDRNADAAEVIAEGAEKNLRVPRRNSLRPLRLNSLSHHATSTRIITISSEHFRVSYPANVDRRDANLMLNTLESARSDFVRRASAASISVPEIPTMEIRLNENTGDFTSRTGQPWWAAAATKGNRIELQPVEILKRRGVLITTLRHELAHAVIDSISRNRAPRWLEEGFALYLAGEGPTISRYAPKTNLTADELERKLERPGSQQEMRALYALAYQKVIEVVRGSGEATVWKRLSQS